MSSVEYIIAGFERGGTTLLSDIFRQNGFESGFECGVLLAESPSAMNNHSPYWEMLLTGWKISEAARRSASLGTFESFYDVICAEAFPDFKGKFFDKTPRYMKSLGLCMSRAPFLKGAVVIHRDPRAFFVSAAKRLEPDMDAISAIDRHFNELQDHYLSYFFGSIIHIENPSVLFVPFEELVSREQAWLRAIGYFVSGRPFMPRTTESRFHNVTSPEMDLSKVIEFDNVLPKDLQERILDATQIASIFFAGPVERSRYANLWIKTFSLAKQRIAEFELEPLGTNVDGTYFEPLTYLIRYPDVLHAGVCPIKHYRQSGKRENRIPA